MALTAVGLLCTEPGRLELRDVSLPDPGPEDAVVRVAGCGLCHTDVSFYTGAVRTRRPLPLVFGHEVAGTVVSAPAAYAHLAGRGVIIPAVMPCGTCALCADGRDTACTAQVMPGNDISGGFASLMIVPARHLVAVPQDLRGLRLEELAVVADAVTTPYQALRRSSLHSGDLAIVIGVGGIGTFGVQIALALGAQVAAIDIAPQRRETAAAIGARWTFDPAAIDGRAIKKQLLNEADVPTSRWRVLEMSGSSRGQELAWTLLPPAGTLGIVGFTLEKPDIRLSNLMALDATAFGNWGCSPRLYPEALDLVVEGRVQVRPFIDVHPLSDGAALFDAAANHRSNGRRAVLVPAS